MTITEESLAKSAAKFRPELLLLMILGMKESLPHFSLRTGVRYSETVGTLDGPAELRPYTGEKNATDGMAIDARTIFTYLGSCVKEFDPNQLLSSIYGNGITSGKGLESLDINKAVLSLISTKISAGINSNIFSAVRNANGTTTKDLFNGLDTITGKEITDNKLTTALGNLKVLTEAITKSNAYDVIKEIYRSASPELQAEKTKLYIPYDVFNAYNDDYQQTVGSTPYNTQFQKTFVEGSNNNCELVPLTNKTASPYIHLSKKSNMLLGCYQMGDFENIEVRRGDNPFKLQHVSTMFFGTEMESIAKENLLVTKLYVAP